MILVVQSDLIFPARQDRPVRLILTPNSSSVVISTEIRERGTEMDRSESRIPDMVVCLDGMMSYLVSTYTPVRSWSGHGLSTPLAKGMEVKRAFQGGTILLAWESMRVFYISNHNSGWKSRVNSHEVFQNARCDIWEYPSAASAYRVQH